MRILRKAIITGVLLLACGQLFAFKWGMGLYNGVCFSFWWDDRFSSQVSVLSAGATGTEAGIDVINTDISYFIAPFNISLFHNDNINVSAGLKFKETISLKYGQGGSLISGDGNDYTVYVMLPQLEIKMPFAMNLRLITDMGVKANWTTGAGGARTVSAGFYGINLTDFNFGFVYSF